MRFSGDVVADRLSPAAAGCEYLQLAYVSGAEACGHGPCAGLRQVVACALSRKSNVNIEVFGFNWSSKHWETHLVRPLLPSDFRQAC